MRALTLLGSFLSIVVACGSQKPLLNEIYRRPDTRITALFLESSCSRYLKQVLSTLPKPWTIFAPTDQAWNATFNMSNFTGFDNLNCQPKSLQTTNCTCYRPPMANCANLLIGNLSNRTLEEVAPCLPWISLYHLAPGNYSSLQNVTDMGGTTGRMNITVIPTMLNSTSGLVHLSDNSTKVIVANTTTLEDSYLQSGANYTAGIIDAFPGTDGYLYMIDQVLIPPLNLTSTLTDLNLTNFIMALNQSNMNTTNPLLLSTRQITVFAPMNMMDYSTSSFNASSYIVPGPPIYLNQSQPTTLNLTAADGCPLLLDIGQNYMATLNGTSIVEANVPLSNGVLHVLNGTTGTLGAAGGYPNYANTAAARLLRHNRDVWSRWLGAQ